MIRKTIVFAALVAAASFAWAQSEVAPWTPGGENFAVSVISSHTTAAPGQTFHLAVVMDISDGWVFYSPRPGEIVDPGKIAVVAEGFKVGEVLWPADRTYETPIDDNNVVVNHVYKGGTVAFVPLTATGAGKRTIFLTTSGQICGTGVCVPVSAEATVDVSIGDSSSTNAAWTDGLSSARDKAMPADALPAARKTPAPSPRPGVSELSAWTGLGLALLAGLILNIMPCVLPVIPLRVLTLVQMAGERRGRMITLGLSFAGGIVLFFIMLAGVNIVLRLAAEQAFSLSGLLQLQFVRIGLALVLVALAANLFGAFNVVVPSKLAGLGQNGSIDTAGHLSSAGMGLMLAVLATPCSFAILTNVMVWSQLQPLWLGTLAFGVMGLGMAAPHALLVAFPGLLAKLPRPGRWTELFKQTMAFLLLPVAIWLIFTTTDDAYPGWITAYAVVLAMSLWIWGTWVRYDASFKRKLIVRGLAVVLAVGAGMFMLTPSSPPLTKFEDFSNQRIVEAHQQGKTVLVKFTAATCLSCKVLDYKVYNTPEIAKELDRPDIVTMIGDTTNRDAPASVVLRERFGGAVPVTVLFGPGGSEPVRLHGKFSKADLIEALSQVTKPR